MGKKYYLNEKNLESGRLPLGAIFASSVTLNDACFHLLDGSTESQSGIYAQFAEWLKEKYPNGDYSNEEYEQDLLNCGGQCGHYVIDNDAGTIRFPKVTEFVASSNAGKTVGLAQLDEFKSHSHNMNMRWLGAAIGNYYVEPPLTSEAGESYLGTTNRPIQSTGGDETRPKNIRYPYYVVIATGVKTDVEIDINNVANDISNLQGGISQIYTILNKTEKVEVLYDKDSSNPSINRGYTSGIQNDINVSLPDISSDITRLRCSAKVYNNGNSYGTGGCSNIFEIDITKPNTETDGWCIAIPTFSYMNSTGSGFFPKRFSIAGYYNIKTKTLRFYFGYDEVTPGFQQSTYYTINKIWGIKGE